MNKIASDVKNINGTKKVYYGSWAEKFKTVNKQLLDEVFVISRIIKVEVRVISRSQMLRLITLTKTLIILDITKNQI